MPGEIALLDEAVEDVPERLSLEAWWIEAGLDGYRPPATATDTEDER